MAKAAKAIVRMTGPQVKALRTSLKINQLQFWRAVGATQSGGSRYESGREMPVQVEALVRYVFLGQPLGIALASVVKGHAVPDISEVVKAKEVSAALKSLRKQLDIK